MIRQVLNPDNYILTPYAVPLLLVGAAIGVLGIFVLIRERASRIAVMYFFFTVPISIWLTAFGADYASIHASQAFWWSKVSHVGVIFIPTAAFTLTVTIIQRTHHFRRFMVICFVLSFLFCIGHISTNLFFIGLNHYFWGYYPQYGPVGFLFFAYFFGVMITILYLYWVEYRNSANVRHKKRLKGFLLAFGIGYFGAFDFIAAFGIPLYPFGYVPIFIFLVIQAYVIMRYRLVDITPELAAGRILETMQGAVIVVDLEGKMRVVNRAACAVLGQQKSDLLDTDLSSIIELPAELRDYHNVHDSVTHNHEMVWFNKDRQQVDISIAASLLRDKDNFPIGIVYAAHDITQRKKAREKLKKTLMELGRSNQELEQFAYVASHDLQEPLRKVMAFGDRLKEKYGPILGDQGKDYLERIQNATTRMQALISDLLIYSRVTTKAQSFAPVDLNAVVRDVLSDLEVRIQQTGGRVEAGDFITIDADPLQMRQLFQNLMGNALKFHKKKETPVVKVIGAFVHASGTKTDAGVPNNHLYQITVEDNGIGFDEKHADRMFGMFQRLHGRSEYEGSGVGLAICKKIVECHGGAIVARSVPEQGAVFTVTLPVKQLKKEDA